MRNFFKTALINLLVGISLCFSIGPAIAFQMPITPSGIAPIGSKTASAYAENAQRLEAQGTSVLSPHEIRHIAWCAARYRMAYDAVNDIYVVNAGARLKCISPE